MIIAALLTCFNRRDHTVACLRSLKAQVLPEGGLLRIFLVDDGSRDGTTEAARQEWPDATILQGDGNLYWCGGMRLAWKTAQETDPDFYLLINDDTALEFDALASLLPIASDPRHPAIAVAAIAHPETGKIAYGGVLRKGLRLIEPQGTPVRCDTFNANCALIPSSIVQKLGIFHKAYTHAMGDFDYGFMASRAGYPIFQSGNFLGKCSPNPVTGSWRDRSLPRSRRWQILLSPKGLPPREWWAYTRRNCGPAWPLIFLSPYLKVIMRR